MNLTEWAHAQGIHVQTAYRWRRERTLPVSMQKDIGHIAAKLQFSGDDAV